MLYNVAGTLLWPFAVLEALRLQGFLLVHRKFRPALSCDVLFSVGEFGPSYY